MTSVQPAITANSGSYSSSVQDFIQDQYFNKEDFILQPQLYDEKDM
jgi:hypothetical protein